jgi:HEAT repeat protein
VVIEKQTTYAQPQGINENTFEDLRYKKTELLTMLDTGDKVQRNKAIKELAGFSFDDKVRQAIEKVLLSDPDPELRQSAAQALGEVKNIKAKPALEKARVEDSAADVRKAADGSIGKL